MCIDNIIYSFIIAFWLYEYPSGWFCFDLRSDRENICKCKQRKQQEDLKKLTFYYHADFKVKVKTVLLLFSAELKMELLKVIESKEGLEKQLEEEKKTSGILITKKPSDRISFPQYHNRWILLLLTVNFKSNIVRCYSFW